MNSKDAMNFDEYQQQKLHAELANAILVHSNALLSEENITPLVARLGEIIGEFASEYGYKPSDKAKVIIKLPSSLSTCDPTNRLASIGGKVDCDLTATKDQYVLYAGKIIDALKAECKAQIEKTWQERLAEHLTFLFYGGPEEPIRFEDEYELKREFSEKKDKFIEELEALVEKFKIPVLE
jgi:hypothetical protein